MNNIGPNKSIIKISRWPVYRLEDAEKKFIKNAQKFKIR